MSAEQIEKYIEDDERYRGLRWLFYAECEGEDPELFFPTGDKSASAKIQIEAAKQVCNRCDVRERCLDWALEGGFDHGVWGGLSERERRLLKKRKPTSPTA